jgi:23S rRNA pseudouridine2605 synthase
MRIAKYIANAGICSRREAERLIENQQVKINDQLCTHPSTKVKEKDKIKVKGKLIKNNQSLRLWKLYKPIKYICTNNDPQKRKTIFSLIPKDYPRLISIGRLDYMSEGLILFTNNGNFSRKLELPSYKYERVYRVCIRGNVDQKDLKAINKGIYINRIRYKKIYVTVEKYLKTYSWLIVKLKEGKNREIRKVCDYFSWNIVKLIRIQYGPYKLLNLKKGQIIEIKKIVHYT